MSQRPLSFVVIHPEALAAEGIAVGLARYPGLIVAGTARSVPEGLQFADRADAVVVHAGLDGANVCARRLRARGVQVVLIGATREIRHP